VHAEDLAQGFMQALTHWSRAVGESFNIASPSAMTWRGYAEAAAGWFGQTANLRFVAWDEFKAAATEEAAAVKMDQLAQSIGAHAIRRAEAAAASSRRLR